LRTSDNLGTVDPEGTLAFTFTCAAGFHRPAGAADCKRCGGNNEYPDPDDNTRCLVCQDPMTVKDDGSGCRCADAHYDARAELLVCYEVGESWSAADFDGAPAKDAAEPQCLPCGDCLTCKDGLAKVAKGYMVSEADKAVAAGSTSTCGCVARAASSLSPRLHLPHAFGQTNPMREQRPGWTPRCLRMPPRGVHRNPSLQRHTARQLDPSISTLNPLHHFCDCLWHLICTSLHKLCFCSCHSACSPRLCGAELSECATSPDGTSMCGTGYGGTLCSVCVADYTKSSSQCVDCSDASGYSSVILAGIVVSVLVVGCCVASAFQADAEDQAGDAADQLAQGESGRWWQSLMVSAPSAPHVHRTCSEDDTLSSCLSSQLHTGDGQDPHRPASDAQRTPGRPLADLP
jgi:hypothetical protein